MKTIQEALKEGNNGLNQSIKGDFIGKHVLCNVNSLVEYCLKHGSEDPDAPVNFDEIENLYTLPEYYGTYASFPGGTEQDRDNEIERLQDLIDNDPEIEGDTEELIKSEILALEELETEAQEIFEWWAVSSYLYEQLKAKGQPVVDAGSCYIWGRCTTGQAILLDHVISEICAEMEILEGQPNAWK